MKFKAYDHTLLSVVESFQIKETDRPFTKTPLDNIKLARQDSERHPTLVFDEQGHCIGFFTLHEGAGVRPYTANPKALFFRSFSMDQRYRGKGYGKLVMQRLPHYICLNFPEVNEIYLTVNKDNVVGQKLYARCGYQCVGESELEGRPVDVLKYVLTSSK